jgi:hypothetical protein
MRVITRAAVAVAVILCGGVAMLSFWSWRPVPSRRADGPASSGWRGSPPLSYPRIQVNLDLGERRPESLGELSRDPFRFYVRPAMLSPHIKRAPPGPTRSEPVLSVPPPGVPMPWKLMGMLQRNTTRWAVFSDCRSIPVLIAEGGSLEGQWRVTTIGLESVTLRALDDREIVLPLRGCQPR